jgi:hypothetical protein
MCKRVMLGLAALTLGALVWGSADAGCPLGRFCATGYNASGSGTGHIIAPRGQYAPTQVPACAGIMTLQGSGELPPPDDLGILLDEEQVFTVRMKLAGTVPTSGGQKCGLGPGEDQCNVQISVDCTDRIIKNAETGGPLLAGSNLGFGQSNNGFGPDLANYTFKLNPGEGDEICAAHGAGPFKDWSLRQAFFEACVNADCMQELCRGDQGGGGNQDRIRPWHCRPL